MHSYDAILVVSFGGPEGPDDVLPFLENVLRGRNVPRERMLEVAEHYQHFGGVSPLNEQNRQLIAALQRELDECGPRLPIYWGNRNWRPFLADALREMAAAGVKRALAFITSPYNSYSGCRQYLENIEAARAEVGAAAPVVDKLRAFFNHPGFVEPQIKSLRQCFERIAPAQLAAAQVLFTAHSIPTSMAATSNYEMQLRETSRLVAEGAGAEKWELVFQSRSGPPTQPWLEPDVCQRIEELHQSKPLSDLIIVPIGFISDHMEVLYDLDVEASQLCEKRGINLQRAATVGVHPRFVRMIRELISERIDDGERTTLGKLPPAADICPAECCQHAPAGRK